MSTDPSTDPDAIRAEIERTRQNLSDDVDQLSYEASPSTQAHRQVDRVKGKAAGLKDKVMGSVDDARSSSRSPSDAASDTQDAVAERTRGNPVAAGLIAFGAGWLAASLLPSSSKEQQLAEQAKDSAQPLVQSVKSSAQDAAQDLKEPAQDAAQSVKDKATDAGQTVKDQGQAAAQDVKGDAQGSAQQVRQTRS